jgi:hypothetical protein
MKEVRRRIEQRHDEIIVNTEQKKRKRRKRKFKIVDKVNVDMMLGFDGDKKYQMISEHPRGGQKEIFHDYDEPIFDIL